MSFNIVLVVSVAILAFFMPIIAYFSFISGAEVYRKGVEHGKNFDERVKSETVLPKIRKKPKKNDANVEKFNALMRNLEAYDGTSFGQEEIND